MRDTAILLLNLGGPVNLDQVEPFLAALFGDRDLIKLPGPAWLQGPFSKLIAKLRAPGARGRYSEIGGGSPLLKESAFQASALRAALRAQGRHEPVKLCFRYAAPRAAGLLKALKRDGIRKLVPVTLYPHDCRATTGSSLRELAVEAAKAGLEILPGVDHYATDADYLDSLEAPLRKALQELPGATVIFSAHSLPLRQIEAGDPYEKEIHATRDALMARIGEIPGGYLLAYQSRTGPVKWLQPPLKDVLETMKGKDVIVVPMSFVSEHIETLHELDIEYRHVADAAGIRTYRRVAAPGTDPAYIQCLTRRVLEVLP
ncbi:ferrochelatase [Geothrix sp. PMB-07]|uniref:ferrochelatase n=1 Tax=Geothrix sp. PMB-07 TaxID=3068640 RepID=UPI0027412819|nr:ferrochelatase [Geothrix sp. PMB-07]WLT29957.1 ferrochelatase [Geothrix sp. PMB-07]